jgi:uncharacterized protein (TIGR03086 family)
MTPGGGPPPDTYPEPQFCLVSAHPPVHPQGDTSRGSDCGSRAWRAAHDTYPGAGIPGRGMGSGRLAGIVEIIRSAHLGSGIVDQLSEALLSAAALVDDLPQRSLGLASPCRGWSVLDVINHLAAVTEKFGRFASGTAGPVRELPGDLVQTQPARRFRDIAEAAASTWREHPSALTAVCVLPFGSFDGATAAGINLFDAVIHQWDIAVGAGIDDTISEELAVVALSVAPLLVTRQARLSGHYAAPAFPPASAPPSAQLLAATGRQQKLPPLQPRSS